MKANGFLHIMGCCFLFIALVMSFAHSQTLVTRRSDELLGMSGNSSGETLQNQPRQITHQDIYSPPSMRAPLATQLKISTTIEVTNTADGGVGSLRKAIDSSNSSPGLDQIIFQIPGAGIHTIMPNSSLPQITGPVIIDGTTQLGFSGTPIIELSGSLAGITANGLYLKGGSSVVRGLVINRFTNTTGLNGFGIVLDVNGGNTIAGNYIGTDVSGTTALPNRVGISITGTSGGNVIGGTTPETRNVISGNISSGISTLNGTVGGNFITGNFVGLNAAGTVTLGNGGNGVFIVSPNNTIGGLEQGSRNIISGNALPGLGIGSTGGGTVVQGNYIGTDVTGSVALGNSQNGVIISGSPNNTIGGASDNDRNVISGNGRTGAGFPGIVITGAAASGNKVQGNYIGTNANGTFALGNGSGINISGAPNNTIGGAVLGEGNVVSGNLAFGLGMLNAGATGNKVIANFIGTNTNGTISIPNSEGILINNAPRNIIGGEAEGEENLVSGNSTYGIEIRNAGAVGNKILNNFIGTNVLNQSNIGNGSHGVVIISSQDTVILNTIAYNAGSGVYDSAGTQNLIMFNSIFSNTGRGIDLAPVGLAIDDSLDNDTGPNDLQNFPLLDSSRVTESGLLIHGRLNSKPNSHFQIDFYANEDFDQSHFGEGQSWSAQIEVVTDIGGNASFSVPITIGSESYVTATATDAAGNTSEFSQALCLIDTDSDGILDSWEMPGWGIDVNSDGIIDLDLATMGATETKDIFVEVDAMTGMAPQDATLQNVIDAFGVAGANGINLIIQKSDFNITPVPWLLDWWTSFDAVKRAYFGTLAERTSPNARFILEAKKLVFRYGVFAYQHTTQLSSGRAEENFAQGCDDFMVTLGAWPNSGGTEDEKAGTFMHELGHTLGLHHGGGDDINYKPNYISIMNYTWQVPLKWANTWRLDYSVETLPTLNESSLDEFNGLGVPEGSLFPRLITVPYSGPGKGILYAKLKPHEFVDWDSSGSFDLSPVAADLNSFADTLSSPGDTLVSQEDWSKLIYNFRSSPDFLNTRRSSLVPATDELDFETFQFLDNLPPPKPKGEFVMDGQLDTSAVLVATNAGINLYARYKSGQLYVATNSAQSQGADMFIFIADARNALRSAPSGKVGQVPAWSVYLTDKISGNSSEWFDTLEVPLTNITVDSVGSVLEGVIDVELLYGKTPTDLFIAVGKYGTDSSGALLAQVPVGNGDGNIDPQELFWFLGAPPPPYLYFTQQGNKLIGSGATGNAWQGSSVSISADGNTALVGGNEDNNGVGAAWVFTRSGGVWNQQGSKLVCAGSIGIALIGKSVSLSGDGNTAIVGGLNDSLGQGAAWVFTRTGGVWTQQRKIAGSLTGVYVLGYSVSLSSDGNTAILGGMASTNGHPVALVYTRIGGVWSQQGSVLDGTGAVPGGTGVAVSLSADGNTAIVGGREDDLAKGASWIFVRSGGVWSQQGNKLVGSPAINATRQGSSVSLSSDGNTAMIGKSVNGIGGAWVFTRSGGVWNQQGSQLVATGTVGNSGNQLGISVSLSGDGNIALVGGKADNDFVGAVWVFKRNGSVWTQEGEKVVGTGGVGSSNQGFSVSLSSDGNTALVGGVGDNANVGAAWVFTHDTPLPIQLASFTATIVNGGNVRLDWTTLSEINNYGFHVQRSPENESNYQTLTNSFIPGHGTTNEPQHYSFADVSVLPGQWYYRLKQIDLDGTVHYSDGVTINTLTEVSGSQLPDKFGLSQNYPDPFNPVTTIQYQLPQVAHVTLKIYNVLGQEVVTLADDVEAAGYKSVVWNATNVASGVYFCRITATSGQTIFVDVRKMLAMK
jgi:hypothetical protein